MAAADLDGPGFPLLGGLVQLILAVTSPALRGGRSRRRC